MTHPRPWPTFLKLVVVLALAVILFFVKTPAVLGLLLAAQLVVWVAARLSVRALWRSVYRLRIFFLFILVSYAFISTGDGSLDRWLPLALADWTLEINVGGVAFAALMCLRVAILVIASAWMQRSAPAGALVDALRMLKLPESLAITVDATLALLAGGGGSGHGTGKGRGNGRGRHKQDSETSGISFRAIRRGELGGINELIDRSLRRARNYLRERYPDLGERALHDMTIVLAVSLAVMGLKVLQILPGVPIASGHKNIIIVPLLLFAAAATHSRLGGLLAGTAVGIVSFLLGYGKYGVLEIAHFALPGLLADLLMPLLRAQGRTGRLVQFAFAGVLLGAGRFTANLLVIFLAGAPLPAFILFAPMLISQITFGALSCFASILIVRKERSTRSIELDSTESPGEFDHAENTRRSNK